MSTHDAERMLELEESAEGVVLFRPPGDDLLLEKARDQAEASGWIPDHDEPSTRVQATRERRDMLLMAMHRLEAAAARAGSAPGWLETVHEALVAVSRAFELHVEATEGEGGLLNEILVLAPRLSTELALAKGEHRDLERAIARLTAALREPSDTRAIRRRVMRLLGHLVDHRQRGSDLVYEAYSVDLGAGG